MDNGANKKSAIVIGTGAGGAIMAAELQGKYDVIILEAGKKFEPFSYPISQLSDLRQSGLFFDERLISLLLPNMRIKKTKDMVLVRGIGVGGTTPLATGNAVRCDEELRRIGIDLDEQFDELYHTLPITTNHRMHWTQTTEEMFSLFEKMDLEPVVTPKFMNARKCVECGHCAIGCPTLAKWDTRYLIKQAIFKGARIKTGCKVTRLDIENNTVKGVHANHRGKREILKADLVVLAAGGLGTPVILQNSGIACESSLFVDPVLCVAGESEDFGQDRQLLMPFISQQDGYIISPYMDYLSYFFDKNWRKPMNNIASIMIKLADESVGYVSGKKNSKLTNKSINKNMTSNDWQRMNIAVEQCKEILARLGIKEEDQFMGILNAGHPGGMLPLTENEKETLHNPTLPENLYVADASLLPKSTGNPPILTIMALAKKIAAKL